MGAPDLGSFGGDSLKHVGFRSSRSEGHENLTSVELDFAALHCTALDCTALHCTAPELQKELINWHTNGHLLQLITYWTVGLCRQHWRVVLNLCQ